ncbi:hypothetical protein SAMN04488102_101168 [Alkalibacterium subtropicum]|uniref:Uncharacterized protein n=1 Tax=Alkalibacterium subtropicum TaxID=753702 RepID=A0A1I1ENB4_9LACT|nr:hypothetical protein [Alkalibacterium subtropicum]SFB86403.1 hypothetical protein SAMN04488102_101168 [Alkalibacterium subtropicum]
MLTEDQIKELEHLLNEHKNNDQSLRIADVTNLIYPIDPDKKEKQSCMK